MTIEERAFEYANNNPHGNPYNWNAHHDAYITGATEQKAIDIDKACEWWNKELREVNYGTYQEALDAFRKFMEEENENQNRNQE